MAFHASPGHVSHLWYTEMYGITGVLLAGDGKDDTMSLKILICGIFGVLGDARWTWPALGPPPGGFGEHHNHLTRILHMRQQFMRQLWCAPDVRGGGGAWDEPDVQAQLDWRGHVNGG